MVLLDAPYDSTLAVWSCRRILDCSSGYHQNVSKAGPLSLTIRKGYKEDTAGFLSSGSSVIQVCCHSPKSVAIINIQVVLAPVLGYVIDRWGHRFHYVAAAPILWITACSLLGFTSSHPMVALVIASLAGVINGAPLRS